MDKDYYGWWFPIDISTHGSRIDGMIDILHWFMLALFIGWGAFYLYTIFRFRASANPKADYQGMTSHFSTYLEVGVAAFEVFLLVGLAIPLWADVKADVPSQPDLELRVVAEQFAWNVHYPGPDGKFGRSDVNLVGASNPLGLDSNDENGKDDITTINQMNFPVGKQVLVHLSSKDVIHSFALNVMRVKQDAIPGQTVPVWFKATETGDFEISCAQLCGLGHYRMKGFFSVQTEEEFNGWLAEQAEASSGDDGYY